MTQNLCLLGSRRPRDQMLAESNQEGSRRQSGTRNKPKGRAGVWIYRWEIGKALQARKHCEKGHTRLGGWVCILRQLRKKKAPQEAENRRARIVRGGDAILQRKRSPKDSWQLKWWRLDHQPVFPLTGKLKSWKESMHTGHRVRETGDKNLGFWALAWSSSLWYHPCRLVVVHKWCFRQIWQQNAKEERGLSPADCKNYSRVSWWRDETQVKWGTCAGCEDHGKGRNKRTWQ